MDKHSKHDRLVLILSIVLVSILVLYPAIAQEKLISFEKNEYHVQELVEVSLKLDNLETAYLELETPISIYNYPEPSSSVRFITREQGQHTVRLYDSGNLLASESFLVGELQVDIDDLVYFSVINPEIKVDEPAIIKFDESLLKDSFRLEISSESQQFNYLNSLKSEIWFLPKTFGEYQIRLYDTDLLIQTGGFNVSEVKLTQEVQVVSESKITNASEENKTKVFLDVPSNFTTNITQNASDNLALTESVRPTIQANETFLIINKTLNHTQGQNVSESEEDTINESMDSVDSKELEKEEIEETYQDTLSEDDIIEGYLELKQNISEGTSVISELITDRSPIVAGNPVKWTKNITLEEISNISLDLPNTAANIRVIKLENGTESEVEAPIVRLGGDEPVSILNIDSIDDLGKFLLSLFTAQEEPEQEILRVILQENATKYLVEYYTAAPLIEEEETGYGKRVKVSAPDELYYTDVISHATIPERFDVSEKDKIKIYWVEDRKYVEFNAFDIDNDGLLDYVEWITPHLSEQTFEISLLILNVQSYPVVGGDWIVKFKTTGTADLRITAVDGTSWSNDSGRYDLRFLELRCGDELLEYQWVGNSVFVEDYECEDTGYEVSRVLTGGKHHLKFEFGTETAYAHNDAVYSVFLFWDDVSDAPTGWTCVSCDPGDPFYQAFPRGSDVYGGTGGAATHTHTITYEGETAGASFSRRSWNTARSSGGHVHGSISSTSVSSESNLPSYRNLKVISYDDGTPSTIPAGAIAIFNSTLPSGWTRYAAQDDYFIRGEGSISTGGSNTHDHDVSYTLDASGDTASFWDNTNAAADDSHTHTVSDTSDSASNVPPFIEIILAKADSDTSIPNGIIAMLNATPDSSWDIISENGEDYYERFIVANDTYGDTGGSSTNTHPDLTSTTSGPTATGNARNWNPDTSVATNTHTHDVTVSFSEDTSLPPYIDVLFGYFADITGPNATLDRPPNYQKIATAEYMVNASAVDDFSSISAVVFEYRESPSESWVNICTDYTAPYNCTWDVSSLPDGDQYEVRAYANDSIGNLGSEDIHSNIQIGEVPIIGATYCFMQGTGWVNCTTFGFGDTMTIVRTSCEPAATTISNVTFILKNVDDDFIYFNVTTTDNSTGYWEYDISDVEIVDSGGFNLHITCRENPEANEDLDWEVPFGTLSAQLISPSTDVNITQNQFSSFTSRVTCTGGECGWINATLDPAYKINFTSAGADTFTVPAGVTNITVKAWGGGGGGGGGGGNEAGANGAGAGFAQATISVTPGETLDIYIGGGGTGGEGSDGEA
ncbi:hypothetical protein JXC34_00075, partial [Candidatus Woesearchaeota archaeon]|nr:hypothetical protein [Candidatus Woesearchaeota archaeon]